VLRCDLVLAFAAPALLHSREQDITHVIKEALHCYRAVGMLILNYKIALIQLAARWRTKAKRSNFKCPRIAEE
jgi:hypothetical protein